MTQEQIAEQIKDLKEVMKFTEEQYFDLVVDAGFAYTNRVAYWTDTGKELLKRWPQFWSWFRAKWVMVDLILLQNMLLEMEVMSLENYLAKHEAALGNELPYTFWNKINNNRKDKIKQAA